MAFFFGKRKPIVHEPAVTSGIDRVAESFGASDAHTTEVNSREAGMQDGLTLIIS